MRVILDSTDKIVDLVVDDGRTIPARIWEGHTERGIACHAYITRIAVADPLDASEFERDLTECRPATPAVAAIPTRLIV